MSFLPPDQLTELCWLAGISDKEIRSDLIRGLIKDENDYTSNFTSTLRRNINSHSQTGLTATSFLLSHSEEREVGADATIVLTRGSESKVALFEAKWPRFSKPGYGWDYDQTVSGTSHYSGQLERQKKWLHHFAIFEMFYSEEPFQTKQPYLTPFGSSCVWHQEAEAFRQSRNQPDSVWPQAELQKLLSAHHVGIETIMLAFGLCQKGQPLQTAEAEAIGREFRLPARVLSINASTDHRFET